MNKKTIEKILKKYEVNTPAYLFDSNQFVYNIKKLRKAFMKNYTNFSIGYSYKTNYTPDICDLASVLGCYAEVVSPFELHIAKSSKYIDDGMIIYNGVCSDFVSKYEAAYNGSKVNVDNLYELKEIEKIASSRSPVKIGLRVTFDIYNGLNSRFGMVVGGKEFDEALEIIEASENLELIGFHSHFSKSRELPFWETKINQMIELAEKYDVEYIDLGSNMYSEMCDELKAQYGENIPSFYDYSDVVAKRMKEAFPDERCELILETGTPLVANAMGLLAQVKAIKHAYENHAILDCSKFDLGFIAEVKDLPVDVLASEDSENYESINLVGYTCIEDDFCKRDYTGKIGVGDYVYFSNIGAYSVSKNSNFIMPVPAVIFVDGYKIKGFSRRRTSYYQAMNEYTRGI